jgi:hypothetical protein
LLTAILIAWATTAAADSARPWTHLPRDRWEGEKTAVVPGLEGPQAVVVAYPAKQASGIGGRSAGSLPAGLYDLRLRLRPAHVADAIAFTSGLKVGVGGQDLATLPGQFFSRSLQPEERTLRFVHAGGPLTVSLAAFADAATCELIFTKQTLAKGGVTLDDASTSLDDAPEGLDEIDLDVTFVPTSAVFHVVESIDYRLVSATGRIVKVGRDKIRYLPGETLRGSATVADAGRRGGTGTLVVSLEHGVRDRTEIVRLPVTLAKEPVTVPFEIPLPREELGYAVVAEFISADGADRHEAAEYFTIAENFNRVYIAGPAGGGHGSTKASDEQIRGGIDGCVAGYGNAFEAFAWAEEDMTEMTPDGEYWFSGQTCYHMTKSGLQRINALARERGVAAVSYGKFIMSGHLGWTMAYDHPADCRGQYVYPVGMYEGIDPPALDRFRNREFVIYENNPFKIGENPFDPFWQTFLPINPDATPRMVKIAAEEMAASADMFGWSVIRWDGHPRGGGQCGGPGPYDAAAARRTQSLVRLFKDILARRHPNFGHGYNYLMVQKNPTHDWAIGDFEVDELCRGGVLIMNESIGNATPGWPYADIAKNLQVDGDLVRERGGYYLGIGFAAQPRDTLVENALWAAAGARPYNPACRFETRRYLTRYAQYTLDERLRRLATPERVLAPVAETKLWWQPFVYETPQEGSRRQLVVNFLNLPLEEPRTGEFEKPRYTMRPGTDPVSFRLTLPAGLTARKVSLIDPESLAVTEIPLADGRFEVPSVAIWLVGVIDLDVAEGTPTLASLYGPPVTLGVARKGAPPPAELVIDPDKQVWEVNKDLSALAPPSAVAARSQQAFDSLPPAERRKKLLALREKNTAESMIAGWWKGGTLPADLALRDKSRQFGDLAPVRNGRFDIHHARGALDERLRLPEAFAGLPQFAVHDAPLVGLFRAGGGHSLAGGVGWKRYPEFDLLLFTSIPHCAIGAENSYALADYVKAGGAAFFTGGEYAFGKGGYNYTVLERDLLPVLCTEVVDTRASEAPQPISPGPDFDLLGVKADFSAQPAFWSWNQVLVKEDPTVKVLLQSGNRPVLVGWQVGKGRVACLLVDHRGRSGPTADGSHATAFFDWKAWPRVMEGLLRWLAPAALEGSPAAAEGLARLAAIAAPPAEESLDDVIDSLTDPVTADEQGLLAEPGDKLAERLERVAAIASHPAADRLAEGRQRVAALDAEEAKRKGAYIRYTMAPGDDFSLAAPAGPLLAKDELLERFASLAYLVQHEPDECGEAFLREWLRARQYQEYARLSIAGIWSDKLTSPPVKRARAADHQAIAAAFAELAQATRPLAESLIVHHPQVAAGPIANMHFLAEVRSAIELRGGLSPDTTRPVLDAAASSHPDLAAFARARREAAGPTAVVPAED